MSEPSAEPKRGISTWLMISILINVLLIGLIGGRMIGRANTVKDVPGIGATSETRVARRILDNVSRRDRLELGRMFAETLRDNREIIIERNLARRALSAALVAEPYNDEDVRLAMAELREADLALQAAMQDALSVGFARLTAEQRAALARSIERGSPIGDRPPPPGGPRFGGPDRLPPPTEGPPPD